MIEFYIGGQKKLAYRTVLKYLISFCAAYSDMEHNRWTRSNPLFKTSMYTNSTNWNSIRYIISTFWNTLSLKRSSYINVGKQVTKTTTTDINTHASQMLTLSLLTKYKNFLSGLKVMFPKHIWIVRNIPTCHRIYFLLNYDLQWLIRQLKNRLHNYIFIMFIQTVSLHPSTCIK